MFPVSIFNTNASQVLMVKLAKNKSLPRVTPWVCLTIKAQPLFTNVTVCNEARGDMDKTKQEMAWAASCDR